MASVLKMFSNLKSGNAHPKKSASPNRIPEQDCGEGVPNDLLNRRRVSISKSGRYKENHKRRVMLQEASEEEDKDEKNKENEQNQLNLAKRDADLDGHAVADEIEYLAKTIEAKTNLGLT